MYQVALKEDFDAKKFTFSGSWTAPRTMLKLSAGPLALLNVEYLVTDMELAAEDLLMGLPVLRHFGVDNETLLEDRRNLLSETDCSNAAPNNQDGRVGRLMIARLKHFKRLPRRYIDKQLTREIRLK